MNLNVSSSSQWNNVFSIFYVIFYCTFINVRYFVYFGWGSSIIYGVSAAGAASDTRARLLVRACPWPTDRQAAFGA